MNDLDPPGSFGAPGPGGRNRSGVLMSDRRRISQEVADAMREQADRSARAPKLAEQRDVLNDVLRGQRDGRRKRSDAISAPSRAATMVTSTPTVESFGRDTGKPAPSGSPLPAVFVSPAERSSPPFRRARLLDGAQEARRSDRGGIRTGARGTAIGPALPARSFRDQPGRMPGQDTTGGSPVAARRASISSRYPANRDTSHTGRHLEGRETSHELKYFVSERAEMTEPPREGCSLASCSARDLDAKQ